MVRMNYERVQKNDSLQYEQGLVAIGTSKMGGRGRRRGLPRGTVASTVRVALPYIGTNPYTDTNPDTPTEFFTVFLQFYRTLGL